MKNIPPKKRSFLLKLFLLEALAFLLLMSKAQAGGPGQSTQQSDSQSTINKPAVSRASTPNWENWEQSYWFNGNICRERGANTICLTPRQAQENRWSIPENQERNR